MTNKREGTKERALTDLLVGFVEAAPNDGHAEREEAKHQRRHHEAVRRRRAVVQGGGASTGEPTGAQRAANVAHARRVHVMEQPDACAGSWLPPLASRAGARGAAAGRCEIKAVDGTRTKSAVDVPRKHAELVQLARVERARRRLRTHALSHHKSTVEAKHRCVSARF